MKIWTLVLGAMLLTQAATAQKKKKMEVPNAVTRSFEVTYPHAKKTTWDQEGMEYMVPFRDEDRKEKSVVYNEVGRIERLIENMEKEDLPEAITVFAEDVGEIEDAKKVTVTDGNVYYQVEMNDNTVLFDAGGNLMTTETVTPIQFREEMK